MKKHWFIFILLGLLLLGCTKPEKKAQRPAGPPFPARTATDYGIVDNAGLLDKASLENCNRNLGGMAKDGVYIAFLIQNGVTHPVRYLEEYRKYINIDRYDTLSPLEGGRDIAVFLYMPDRKELKPNYGTGMTNLIMRLGVDKKAGAIIDSLNQDANYNRWISDLVYRICEDAQ